jgi:hypothetical protein
MPSRLFSARPLLLASIGYGLLTLALTWPLAAGLGHRVPAGDKDLWQNYWNAWWWEKAVREGISPFRTDLLFHPTGASLGWHTHSPANVGPMIPVALAADGLGLDGPATAVSTSILLGFFLAALGGFFLASEVTGSPGPSFLAGIVLGFFPHHVEQSLEHLNLSSYWAMPFALVFLARAARGDGWRAWLPAGFFLGLNALLSWHNGALIAFTSLAVAVAALVRAPRRRSGLVGIALSVGLSLLITLPFLWPMFQELLGGGGGLKEPVQKPIDPLFLVIPSSGHPFWGSSVAWIYREFRLYPSMGFMAYVGIAAISLCIAATAYRTPPRPDPQDPAAPGPALAGRRPFPFWAALALLHLLLALGSSLVVAKRTIPGIPLPFALLSEVPVLRLIPDTVRVANRFVPPAMLAVSVLCALGAAAASRPFRRPALGRSMIAALGAALVLDFLWIPYPVRDIPRPLYLEHLAKLPAGLAVLDIPTGNGPRASRDMLAQTRHGRPIAGGYISRPPPGIKKTLEDHPALEVIFLAHPRPWFGPETLPQAIRALEVGIVVVHLDREMGRLQAEREAARQKFPDDLYTPRLFDPEIGIHADDLERARGQLKEAFGAPVYQDADSEIYLVR